MSRTIFSTTLITAALALGAPVMAQTAAATAADSTMSQFQFTGMINADNVYVRSAGSENDYPVLRLNKGDSVTVVGQTSEWLKILPPEGVFCLVGKMWVDARGDGTVGRVREGTKDVNIRVGSTLNNMIARVVTTVDGGTDVKILGNQDDNYKIAPPAGAFVYVNKRFVDVVKRVTVVNNGGTMEVKPAVDQPAPTPTPDPMAKTDNPPTPSPDSKIDNPTPTPTPGPVAKTDNPTTEPVAVAPTTAPSAEAQAAFDSLEQRFTDASSKPIGEQPLAELISGYKILADDKTLPDDISKTADARVKSLKVRQELYADYQKNQAEQAAANAKAQPAAAEANEIEQRMKETAVKRFAAVGTLRASALRYNGQTLYRLTDPTSGRTVVYVVTTDPQVKAMEGQFVGVTGDVIDDAARKIRTIAPTAASQVDPGDIAKGTVSAGLVPASLSTATSASAVGQ